MISFILGKKTRQTQGFNKQKNRQVLTELSIGPCYVTQIKHPEQDGYWGIQLGTQTRKPRNITKVFKGKTKKAGIKDPLNFFQEIRINSKLKPVLYTDKQTQGIKIKEQKICLGQKLDPTEIFELNSKVQATGISKGKGFQGVMKRHGFSGGPKTHGQSDRERAPGSIGAGTTPGRVWKGKKMPGRMGNEQVTVTGLIVSQTEKNKLVVQGLVPRSIGGIVLIQSQKKYQ